MLHAGLDLSRRKVDVCLLSSAGEIVDEWASPPDADGLLGLAARAAMWAPAVRGVIESINGARFVHDRLEEHGWDVLIADATKVKGLAPLACKTDKIDARVLATLSARDLVSEIWPPDPCVRRERELARFRLHLVRHRTTLKNRLHALIAFGHPCPVSDLFATPRSSVVRRRQGEVRVVVVGSGRESVGVRRCARGVKAGEAGHVAVPRSLRCLAAPASRPARSLRGPRRHGDRDPARAALRPAARLGHAEHVAHDGLEPA